MASKMARMPLLIDWPQPWLLLKQLKAAPSESPTALAVLARIPSMRSAHTG
eukprot:CAMPEP_0177216894 /NCGR_PEP_ID=MMETSP0367-20130122/34995_1 /TAXON_ID=447022 ORGANISM="Scrippsiella hangoei-like, Strain SHHI-4" /NCGR_SAMPLE_ID=MMETSP0367 /ASSEMBLY_ACC=CAM_ASM_000362 /LENGTH=50 /DNA_ID=CAMNT_0018666429 /DNA_START=243 /DNA_END=395 /DNA_ORIENTATION=-